MSATCGCVEGCVQNMSSEAMGKDEMNPSEAPRVRLAFFLRSSKFVSCASVMLDFFVVLKSKRHLAGAGKMHCWRGDLTSMHRESKESDSKRAQ